MTGNSEYINSMGRRMVYAPDDKYVDKNGYVPEVWRGYDPFGDWRRMTCFLPVLVGFAPRIGRWTRAARRLKLRFPLLLWRLARIWTKPARRPQGIAGAWKNIWDAEEAERQRREEAYEREYLRRRACE